MFPSIGMRGMLLALWAGLAASSTVTAEERLPLRPLPLQKVRFNDVFWSPKLAATMDRSVSNGWNYLGWEIRSLRTAAGEKVEGDLNGTWGEANLYKFMETLAHSLALRPDPALEARVDDLVKLIARAQRSDGYAHAYVINTRKPAWDPAFLDGSHDGYVLGHMIEAAIEY